MTRRLRCWVARTRLESTPCRLPARMSEMSSIHAWTNASVHGDVLYDHLRRGICGSTRRPAVMFPCPNVTLGQGRRETIGTRRQPNETGFFVSWIGSARCQERSSPSHSTWPEGQEGAMRTAIPSTHPSLEPTFVRTASMKRSHNISAYWSDPNHKLEHQSGEVRRYDFCERYHEVWVHDFDRYKQLLDPHVVRPSHDQRASPSIVRNACSEGLMHLIALALMERNANNSMKSLLP